MLNLHHVQPQLILDFMAVLHQLFGACVAAELIPERSIQRIELVALCQSEAADHIRTRDEVGRHE